MMSLKNSFPEGGVVAVLDESPILADALSNLFAANAEAGMEAEAFTWDRLAELRRLAPRILVLDPVQVEGDLEAFVTGLRGSMPDLILIGYASALPETTARTCMRMGFRALLPKTAAQPQLRRALSVVLQGGVYVDRRFGPYILNAPPRPQEAGGEAQLSAREAMVLKRIAGGLSHKQVAAEIGVSAKTIDTYRARGMRKLGLADRSALVRHAIANDWFD